MRAYAGIGSRKTPSDVLELMESIAKQLAKLDFILYSGGAKGADEAFELGAQGNAKIFLPWDGFNGRQEDDKQFIVPRLNYQLVKEHHPAHFKLSNGAVKLMSRNAYQVLGPDLESPVKFVCCWTPDGKASGGTGQAIRIAEAYHIPVFNLYNMMDRIEVIEYAKDIKYD